jgi:Domain of Unknown Function (DUF1080)
MRFFLAACVWALLACSPAAQTLLPQATEVWSPIPAKVTPGARDAAAPSDAVVLFDGTGLAQWRAAEGAGPARWRIADGALVVAPGAGDIATVEAFGDVQLHLEWRTPVLGEDATGQNRGNSGVFLQERYEVQVLDTFVNRTYVNGQAGAIYKQHAPLVNASRPAGEWQSYDIIFTAPRFAADGALASPGRVTVLHNGVLIQNNAEIAGSTAYIGQPVYEPHGAASLRLQDHGAEVAYRNIWLRRL